MSAGKTVLTGKDLKDAKAQFLGQPVCCRFEFSDEGGKVADLTARNIGKPIILC